MFHKISKTRWNEAISSHKRIKNGQKWLSFLNSLPPYIRWQRVELDNVEMSPIKGWPVDKNPWEGNCNKKPWEYSVTAAIPCLDTYEQIEIVVELLRLQTIQPFIMLIDTGSSEDELDKIKSLRNTDLEVHSLQLNGVRNPSDYPAMAMDTAFTLCRTEFLFATHTDCFLRRKNFLEDLITLCKTKSPVVGYQLTPRPHKDWKGMVSHTATMFHMPTMDKIGFGWSLRRLCNQFNIVDYKPIPARPNWPDTEILGNYILRKNNIVPHLIGDEDNTERTLDENIDHCRSFTSGKLYDDSYFMKVMKCYQEAKKEALERIENWKKNI